MSRRRLYYLLDVGALIQHFKIGKETAEQIGSTKLRIITSHITDMGKAPGRSQLKSYLSTAKTTRNFRDLKAVLQGVEGEGRKAFVFHLNADERAELKNALMELGAKRIGSGLVGKETALLAMVKSVMSKKDGE